MCDEIYSFGTYATFQSKFGNSPLLAHNYNLPAFQWPGLEKPGKKDGHPQNLNTLSHDTSCFRVIYSLYDGVYQLICKGNFPF